MPVLALQSLSGEWLSSFREKATGNLEAKKRESWRLGRAAGLFAPDDCAR